MRILRAQKVSKETGWIGFGFVEESEDGISRGVLDESVTVEGITPLFQLQYLVFFPSPIPHFPPSLLPPRYLFLGGGEGEKGEEEQWWVIWRVYLSFFQMSIPSSSSLPSPSFHLPFFRSQAPDYKKPLYCFHPPYQRLYPSTALFIDLERYSLTHSLRGALLRIKRKNGPSCISVLSSVNFIVVSTRVV